MIFREVAIDGRLLSRLALGTHKFARSGQELNTRLLDTFFEAGGNVIDTGRCYQNGESEECVGEWLARRGLRDKFVLITKGGNPDFQSGKAESRLNPQELGRDLAASLEALKTDRIDIYFLHKDDTAQDPEALIEMLNECAGPDVVGHLGASNWTAERIAKANRHAKERGLRPFEYSELAFSLKAESTRGWGKRELALEMERGDFEWYGRSEMPVFGYNPQAYGFFYEKDAQPGETERNKRILETFRSICSDTGLNARQALFGFYFGCGLRNVPIVSTSNIEHLREILSDADMVLDRRSVKSLLAARFEI